MIAVQSIHVYPVKACAGISLREARVTKRGLELDRMWMIVREDGTFITQREVPRLCLVGTSVDDASINLAYGDKTLRVPRALDAGERMEVGVWADRVSAIEHAPARGFVTDVVGEAARLVYMPDDVARPVKTNAEAGDIVSFADGYPVLLASTGSLAELERRAGQSFSMTRFRPNVVIACAEPFVEDSWRRLALGEVRFRAPKGCDRCVVTTVDPETGARGKEPLATLATFRKWDQKVWFAINLVPDTLGVVRVGDPVHLLEKA